jgi:hypothetical protein
MLFATDTANLWERVLTAIVRGSSPLLHLRMETVPGVDLQMETSER